MPSKCLFYYITKADIFFFFVIFNEAIVRKNIRGKASVLSADEFKRLLRVLSSNRYTKRDTLLILFSFGLGLRALEMAAIRINQVIDTDGSVIENLKLTTTKNQKPREVFLSDPRIKKALLEYIEYRKDYAVRKRMIFNLSQPLFMTQRGTAFSSQTLRMLFKNIYLSAGINASSHSGRRQFATNLIEQGMDIKSIQTLMGHSNINETAKYVQENPEKLKRVIVNALY